MNGISAQKLIYFNLFIDLITSLNGPDKWKKILYLHIAIGQEVSETKNIDGFVELIRNQFNENEQHLINANTDLKQLETWSSLQAMIIVNEIDQEFDVILNGDDLKNADSI